VESWLEKTHDTYKKDLSGKLKEITAIKTNIHKQYN
jgi:hypothetical protein